MQFVWKSVGETCEHAVKRSGTHLPVVPYPLDVMAQGVLPTRKLSLLSETYRCNAVLGVATASGDVLGTVKDTCMPVPDGDITRFLRELSLHAVCGPAVTQTLRTYRRAALSDVMDAPPSTQRAKIVADWRRLTCKGLTIIKIELTGVRSDPRELVHRVSVQLGVPAHVFRVTRTCVQVKA